MSTTRTKTALLAVLIVSAALSGCIDDKPVITVNSPGITATETETQYSKYNVAKFDTSDMRASDGFELYWSISESSHYSDRWSVRTDSRYPAYDNMLDDERHSFTVYIDHYETVRGAHEIMEAGMVATFKAPDEKFFIPEKLTYGESSYGYVSAAYANHNNPDEVTGYVGNVFILNGHFIGRILVHGYVDHDECKEVIDYYTPVLSRMLEASA